MERLLIALAIALVAIVIALVTQRRRPEAPTTRQYAVPEQVDRADFPRPEAPWLVAVFTSATCDACAGVWQRASVLDSDAVCAVELEVGVAGDLHRRYRIDAVPTTLVINSTGAVERSFVGPVNSSHLWAAVAELREPGCLPEGCEPLGCDGGPTANDDPSPGSSDTPRD